MTTPQDRARAALRGQNLRDAPEEPRRFPERETDSWARVRDEACRIAPGHFGSLLWLDGRCQQSGMHALDPWWVENFRLFIESGKTRCKGRVGLRGAKSVSVCRALVNDVLFKPRNLDPETIGVVPILSTDKTEATDRFTAIRRILSACGVRPDKEDEFPSLPGGVGGEYESRGNAQSGGGVIRLHDSQGHAIEFRIYPAVVRSVIGFTGVGGFCDEIDMWHDKAINVNPASRVLALLDNRFTTQPDASLYLYSASYHPNTTHTQLIKSGDTASDYVSRLGEMGAAKDDEARARLASVMGLDDKRLFEKADPASTDIPSWVTNPACPIEECYKRSVDLSAMLALYGGRAHEARLPGSHVNQCQGLVEANRRVMGIDDSRREWERGRNRGGKTL